MSEAPAKPRTTDHHKATEPAKWAEVGVAVIRQDGHFINCSCGWDAAHRRTKIREDKAERHVKKRHGGQAMWL